MDTTLLLHLSERACMHQWRMKNGFVACLNTDVCVYVFMDRWATNKVDEKVVSPVTNRLVTSVANPYVMSYLIWDRIKKMTPQRARDMTRLISTAIANAVSVLGAEKGKALTGKTKVRARFPLCGLFLLTD